MARVIVTGANGFVGRHLTRLLLERGHGVVACVRNHGSLQEIPSSCHGLAVGEIERVDWTQVLDGIDFVVHLAAGVHKLKGPGDTDAEGYHRVNVLGTQRLANAAVQAGVTRMVFVSSVKALGEGSIDSNRVYKETDPCAPEDAYGKSKRDAEVLLRQIAGTGRLKVTVIRPPLIYGPGVKANFLSLLKAVDKGVPLPLATVHNRRSLLFVGNLAHAIERCLHEENGRQAFETFFVADDEQVSTPELIARMAHHLQRPVRLLPFPISLMRLAASTVGKRRAIDSLTGSLVVDTSAIRSVLQWRPASTLDEGLAETVAWYRTVHPGR